LSTPAPIRQQRGGERQALTVNAKLTGTAGFRILARLHYGTIVLNGANDYTGDVRSSTRPHDPSGHHGNKGAAGQPRRGHEHHLQRRRQAACATPARAKRPTVFDIRNGGISSTPDQGRGLHRPYRVDHYGSKTLVIKIMPRNWRVFRAPSRTAPARLSHQRG
jgi:hypothetical protein